jgi:hypothetical protein
MKVKEIYVEVGIKKSQDFNSCQKAVGLRGELEANDDPSKMVRQLQEQAYKLLVKKLFTGKEVPAPAQAEPAP